MKKGWKRAAAAVSALCLVLAGCTVPLGSLTEDYDVSGYFQALLDSSYKGDNTAYMSVAAASEEDAQQNNVVTVQNAAVNFCNTYGVLPNDEQLAQLEDVMRQALAQADYTVQDEEKVETGYELNVEIDPIVNFSDLSTQIDRLREETEEEATQAARTTSRDRQDEDDDGLTGDGDPSDRWSSYDGDPYGDSSSDDEDLSSQEDPDVVDTNALFVDKVVKLCQEELETLRYGGETVTITLDIRQTENGELQLDTNQLDTIDRTVLQFQS